MGFGLVAMLDKVEFEVEELKVNGPLIKSKQRKSRGKVRIKGRGSKGGGKVRKERSREM